MKKKKPSKKKGLASGLTTEMKKEQVVLLLDALKAIAIAAINSGEDVRVGVTSAYDMVDVCLKTLMLEAQTKYGVCVQCGENNDGHTHDETEFEIFEGTISETQH